MNKKTKWIFSTSGFSKDAMFAMSTVMSIYLINYYGMSAAFIGIMFMVVRVWDAINDPIMGNIVDNTKSRWGKFRPWIVIGSVLNAIILLFVFFDPGLAPESIQMMIYITFFYTLWGMSYTLMDIPFWSMIPALSSSQKDRETVSVLTRVFTSLGYIIISAMALNLASLLGGGEFNPELASIAEKRIGFFYVAIGVSVIFLVQQVFMASQVKEKITVRNQEKITLKRMFQILKQNDQLMVVMIVIVIVNFTLYITSAMAFYYIAYDIGNEGLYFPFLALGGLVQIGSILTFPLFKKRYTRKQIYNISILIQVAAFVLLFINAFILGNIVPLMFVFGILVFVGQGLAMVLQSILLMDTIEYGELKLGVRTEGIVFSVQTFVVKLATGLAMGVVGVGLAIFGFKSSGEGEDLLPQSEVTIWGIRVMMFILPIIGMLIARNIFNRKHIIDEQKYQDIVKELEVKRGEL